VEQPRELCTNKGETVPLAVFIEFIHDICFVLRYGTTSNATGKSTAMSMGLREGCCGKGASSTDQTLLR